MSIWVAGASVSWIGLCLHVYRGKRRQRIEAPSDSARSDE